MFRKYALCGVVVLGIATSALMAGDKHKHRNRKTKAAQAVAVQERPTEPEFGEVIIERREGQMTAIETDPEVRGLIEGERVIRERREVRQVGPATSPSVVITEATSNCVACPPAKCRAKCSKGDIDDLDAEARCGPKGLQLSLKYEVEIKRATGPHDLVVRIAHRGRLLADQNGQPLTFVIPLETPRKVDDDEAEFKGRMPIPVPVASHRHLRVRAELVDRATGRILDRESTGVELDD